MSSGEELKERATQVGISLDHPHLTKTNPESFRTFLRRYDQYSTTVLARANQLTSNMLTTESITPIDLKFCVDVEFLESSMALGFIPNATTYENITDYQVRTFLEDRCKESKETITLDQLDKMVRYQLRLDLSNKNATARMQDLFSGYHTLLSRNGLKWLIYDNPKIAVEHVLSAIRPQSLQDRLTSDLSFAQHHLRKDIHGFLHHSIRLAEAFQLLDIGPIRKGINQGNTARTNSLGMGHNSSTKSRNQIHSKDGNSNNSSKDELPLCPYEPHHRKGLRHLLKDCRDCPIDEKKRLYAQRAEEKARDGPSKSTCSHTSASAVYNNDTKPTVGRLKQPISVQKSPSCPIVVSDGPASHSGVGRCDDGSDERIASPTLAQEAVIKGIRRMTAIAPIKIKVALKDSNEPATFTFSSTWHVPRLVLKLSSGQMALLNVSLLVADDETLAKTCSSGFQSYVTSVSIHAPYLNRSGVPWTVQTVPKLTMSQESDGQEDNTATHLDPNRPRSNYYDNSHEVNLFPTPFLFQEEEKEKDDAKADADIRAMLKQAKENGFPVEYWDAFEKLIWKYASVFRRSFPAKPAKVRPLRIDLTSDAKPVRVKFRNYSASQRQFMSTLSKDLLKHNLIYPNPTSQWACAPLIVPKSGPDQWRFAVDLRPINRFTKRHQYAMPVIEHELPKLKTSRFYCNFDFIHSYWQMLLHIDSQECQSSLTPDGLFSPTRVLHGTTNAVTHLQSTLTETLPGELDPNLLLWLDDVLMHSESIERHIECVRLFLDYCSQFNWKLHPSKCILFTSSVRSCGRIISSDGIRHDPARLDTLLNMDRPSTGGQL